MNGQLMRRIERLRQARFSNQFDLPILPHGG
jgi:hypothetical protein